MIYLLILLIILFIFVLTYNGGNFWNSEKFTYLDNISFCAVGKNIIMLGEGTSTVTITGKYSLCSYFTKLDFYLKKIGKCASLYIEQSIWDAHNLGSVMDTLSNIKYYISRKHENADLSEDFEKINNDIVKNELIKITKNEMNVNYRNIRTFINICRNLGDYLIIVDKFDDVQKITRLLRQLSEFYLSEYSVYLNPYDNTDNVSIQKKLLFFGYNDLSYVNNMPLLVEKFQTLEDSLPKKYYELITKHIGKTLLDKDPEIDIYISRVCYTEKSCNWDLLTLYKGSLTKISENNNNITARIQIEYNPAQDKIFCKFGKFEYSNKIEPDMEFLLKGLRLFCEMEYIKIFCSASFVIDKSLLSAGICRIQEFSKILPKDNLDVSEENYSKFANAVEFTHYFYVSPFTSDFDKENPDFNEIEKKFPTLTWYYKNIKHTVKISCSGGKVSRTLADFRLAAHFQTELVGTLSIIYYIEENHLKYDSNTAQSFEGMGLNTELRKLLHKFCESKKIPIRTYSINPISDHILMKLGARRYPAFDRILKKNLSNTDKNPNKMYNKTINKYNGSFTHFIDYK